METATLDVNAQARQFRAKLLHQERSVRLQMAREWADIRDELTREIDDLLRVIEARKIATPNQLHRLDRYLSFREQAVTRMTAYSDSAQAKTSQLVQWASTFGGESASALIDGAAVAMGVQMTRPSTAAVEAMVGRVKWGGAAQAFKTIPARGIEATERALINGIALGRNPKVTARLMRQAMDVSVYNAQRIARTETMTAYRAAHTATYAANKPMLTGWRWQATLDERTCAVCWAMDGVVFKPDKPFETHVNCRCTPVPLPKGYEEALKQERPPGDVMFDKLSDAEQRRILGPGRHALYKSGTPLRDMVKRTTDPYWGASRGLRPLREMPGYTPPTPKSPAPKPTPQPAKPTPTGDNPLDAFNEGRPSRSTTRQR